MIDIFTVIFSLLAFGCYLLLQFFFLRSFSSDERIGFLFRLQILVGIFLGGSQLIMWWLNVITMQTFFIVFPVSEFIFHGLVFIYILTVFSYIESSITIKLFAIIGGHEPEGLTRKELEHIYSKDYIVKRRLKRFLAMRVVERDHLMFTLSKKMNSFALRDRIVSLMNIVFPYEKKES
jgi:hypothetical protein